MRSRRRRPRGPRSNVPGAPNPGGPPPEGGAMAAGSAQATRPGAGAGRRRRRSRRGRPNNVAPAPYSNSGGPPPVSRPRGRSQRGNGRPEKRKGLEMLRDMQQAGVALDPTERLVLELPPGKGNPPYSDRITGRAIDMIAPIGRGQRCLIVSPPKAGKTRILQVIASAVSFNHP